MDKTKELFGDSLNNPIEDRILDSYTKINDIVQRTNRVMKIKSFPKDVYASTIYNVKINTQSDDRTY